MKHLGLFEGVGGFSLAARWAGWETLAWCEWNEFGQKVLRHHFPEAEGFGDITKADFTKYANKIDIITGGFPCQPYSTAGKRLGKEDERHLWPEMLRAIQEIQPRWVVGENVRGLISWNGGLVFHEVQVDLENQGYEVQAFLLPACGVNAPHRRDRVWFVAYSNNKGGSSRFGEIQKKDGEVSKRDNNAKFSNSSDGDATNTDSKRLERRIFESRENEFAVPKERKSVNSINSRSNTWENFPTVAPVCNGDDGLSNRLDFITFPKWRNESIKAGGNAIVPQVVYQIFKTMKQFEAYDAAIEMYLSR